MRLVETAPRDPSRIPPRHWSGSRGHLPLNAEPAAAAATGDDIHLRHGHGREPACDAGAHGCLPHRQTSIHAPPPAARLCARPAPQHPSRTKLTPALPDSPMYPCNLCSQPEPLLRQVPPDPDRPVAHHAPYVHGASSSFTAAPHARRPMPCVARHGSLVVNIGWAKGGADGPKGVSIGQQFVPRLTLPWIRMLHNNGIRPPGPTRPSFS